MDLSIIVPSLDEPAIGGVVEGLRGALKARGEPYEILVVDDGSRAPVALPAASDLRVIRHPETLGYGAAIRTGLREARHPWIAITDADGSYRPEDLLRLASEAEGYDMVVGARINPGQPRPFRKPARWVLTKIANYLTGKRIPDINSGQRLFRKEVAERYLPLLPAGFSFTTTITLAFLSDHYPVRFVPVAYDARAGRSKFRPVKDTSRMLALILRTVLYFNPLKIFLPLALLSFLAAIGVFFGSSFIPEPWNRYGAWEMPAQFLLFLSGQFFLVGLLAEVVRRRR